MFVHRLLGLPASSGSKRLRTYSSNSLHLKDPAQAFVLPVYAAGAQRQRFCA
jgi:hypothetical protein